MKHEKNTHLVAKLAIPVIALAFALPFAFAPSVADACGGTFCDGGPPVVMPVDQTGEDILFIRDGDHMEVHVRIEYTGAAERFAWVVPLPAIPAVSVGSEPLFVALQTATIPNWTTLQTFEDPDDDPSGGWSGFLGGDDSEPEQPQVVLEESVGAFEIVVLQGGTAASVLEFFDANDYAYDPQAAPIIQQYLDEGFLMTAVKLSAGASVEAIHPLVFRFVGDEPCVPIRLTAVAAREDMGIRAYFLAHERWSPLNYKHVELNAAAYDWASTGSLSYVELLSLAVDEAGGQAFATDYAGPSAAVVRPSIWAPTWAAHDWANSSASEAMVSLRMFGLLGFNGIPSQLRVILHNYVPVPPTWEFTDDQFWLDFWLHPELIDTPAWDGPAFAADFQELIVEPGAHAVAMLEALPYLTRLHTTMSPHEMTLDPMFQPSPDLPDVVQTRVAGAHVFKDFEWTRYWLPTTLEPDGMVATNARVCIAEDGDWPSFAGMPRALRIEQIPAMGPAQVLIDNDEIIRSMIDAYNEGSPCAADPGDDDPGETGETGGTGGAEEVATKGRRGCAVDPAGGGGTLGFALGLMVLGLARRRRSRA